MPGKKNLEQLTQVMRRIEKYTATEQRLFIDSLTAAKAVNIDISSFFSSFTIPIKPPALDRLE